MIKLLKRKMDREAFLESWMLMLVAVFSAFTYEVF